jgi:short-subunit dehydrogenase
MAGLRPVTLVTGASSGLGVHFAEGCAAEGDELVLVARRADRLEALAARLGNAHAFPFDLSDPEAPERLFAELGRRGMWVRRLVNNAGFGLSGPFALQPLGRLQEMADLNMRSLVTLTHLALAPMLERREGEILNLASTAAFQPGPGMAVYFASKAFVLSFSEALHRELAGTGIRVSALCPGPTATEFGAVAGFGERGAVDRLAADAREVAHIGLAGMRSGKAVVVPGLVNKLSAQASRFLPRAAMRRIVASIKL